MICMNRIAEKAFGIVRPPLSRDERIKLAIDEIKASPQRVDQAIERGIDAKMVDAQARFISLSMTTGRNSVHTVEAELEYFGLIEAEIERMATERVDESGKYEAAA